MSDTEADRDAIIAEHAQMIADMQKLYDDLGSATQLFDNDNHAGAVASLASVLRYLVTCAAHAREAKSAAFYGLALDVDVGVSHRKPLLRLLGALEDAAQGKTHPITSPPRPIDKDGNRQKSKTRMNDDWALGMATACATAKLLVLAGKANAAAISVPEALGRAALVFGVTKAELTEFNKNIGRGRVPSQAADQFRLFIKTAKGSGHSPREQADRAIEFLKGMSIKRVTGGT